jgi:hypothetical protein
MVCIGVDLVRDQSVFLHQVDDHVPLATVADWVFQDLLDEAACQIVIGCCDYLLEEPVGLFDLVPVEEVSLAEFELAELICLDQWNSKDVSSGE